MCAHFLVDVGFLKGNCALLGTKFVNHNNFWCGLFSSCVHTQRFVDSLQSFINEASGI